MDNRTKLKWLLISKGENLAMGWEAERMRDEPWDRYKFINYCSPNLILDEEEREAFGKAWVYDLPTPKAVDRIWEETNDEMYSMTWDWTDEEREAFVKDKDEADKLMKKYEIGNGYPNYDDVLGSIEERERIDEMTEDECKREAVDYWLMWKSEVDPQDLWDVKRKKYHSYRCHTWEDYGDGWIDLFREKWFNKIDKMSDEMVDSIVKKNNAIGLRKGDLIKTKGIGDKVGLVLEDWYHYDRWITLLVGDEKRTCDIESQKKYAIKTISRAGVRL